MEDEDVYDGEACARGECAQCSCDHPGHGEALDSLRKFFGDPEWKHVCEDGFKRREKDE